MGSAGLQGYSRNPAFDAGETHTQDVKRLRQLEEENHKLKHVVAELTLDNRALKDVISKNF